MPPTQQHDNRRMIPDELRRIARNPWLLATGANVVIGLLGMVTAGLIARLLGPTDRGVLAAAVLWSGMLFTALGLPVTQAVVYQWSRARTAEDRGAVVGSALALVAMSASLCLPAALAVNHWVLRGYRYPEIFSAANVFLLSLPLSLVAGAIGAVFLASGLGATFWGLRVVSAAVYFGGVAGAALFGLGTVLWCATALAAGAVVAAVSGIVRLRQQFAIAPRWVPSAFRDMAVFSLKANGVGLPTQVNLRLAQALMTLLVPAAALGQYAVASTWSGIVMLLGGGLSAVLLARSAAAGADAGQMTALFAQFRLVAVAVFLLGGTAALAAPITVPLLFGRAFAPAVLPAALLCLGSAIFTLTLALHEISRGLGHPGVGIPAEVAALGVAAVLLLLLLRPLGGTGAAIASIAGCGTALVVLGIRLDARLDGKLLPAILPTRNDVTALVALARRALRSGHVDADRMVK